MTGIVHIIYHKSSFIPHIQSSLQCQATIITVQATSIEVTHPVDNRGLTQSL